GRLQAEAVAERMSAIGIEAVLTSHYIRAIDTGAFIAKRLNCTPEVHEVFHEWKVPSAVRTLHRESPEAKAIFDQWFQNPDPDFRHSDDESFTELVTRAKAALTLLEKYPASKICVVTHGSFLKVMLGRAVFGDDLTKATFIDLFRSFFPSNTG